MRAIIVEVVNQARNAELAIAIAQMHGMVPTDHLEIVGLGAVNHVFVLSDLSRKWVVRFGLDSSSDRSFEAEAWCHAQAIHAGVPTPEVIATGIMANTPYIVLEFVAGVQGTAVSSDALWHQLGRYAKRIHSIPIDESAPQDLFQRFGRDLPLAWKRHLEYNLDELHGGDCLIELGVYPMDSQGRIREVFERLTVLPLTFGLGHGDLTMQNVLVLPNGNPVILDWGSASAGPQPVGDLVHLFNRHRDVEQPSRTELEAFSEGAELDLDAMLPILEDMTLLSRIDLVRWAIDRCPTRLDEIVAKSQVDVADYLIRVAP